MDSNNFKLLRRILVADFDVSAEAVTSDAQLYESLDLDSIDAVDLIVRC